MSDSEDGKLRGDILVIAIGPAATGKFLLLLLLDQQLQVIFLLLLLDRHLHVQVNSYYYAIGPAPTGKFLLLCYWTGSYR